MCCSHPICENEVTGKVNSKVRYMLNVSFCQWAMTLGPSCGAMDINMLLWASSSPVYCSQVMSMQETEDFKSCPESPPHLGLFHGSHWTSCGYFLTVKELYSQCISCVLSVPALVLRTLTVAGMWWWRNAPAWRRVWAWPSGIRASPPVRYVHILSSFKNIVHGRQTHIAYLLIRSIVTNPKKKLCF